MIKYTFIYSLSDPITKEIRYIGKANNLNKRLATHLTKTNLIKKSYKNNWIKSLLKIGNKPIIEIIDIVPMDNWEFWEIYWISQFKTWGFKLTNISDGGGGVINEIKFGEENYNYNKKINDDEILKLINLGFSQKEIAIKLKTNIALISRRMVKYNINFRKNRGERISNGITHNFRYDITVEKVTELFNQGLSINKISKILKTDRSTIIKRLNK